MTRYRPPQQASAPYITPEGAQVLRDELHALWKVERPLVTAAVHEAAKNGDRSENADYIYGKRRLREIDRRVRYLSKRLEELIVVDRQPDNVECVYFGAWVTLEDSAGEVADYRLVGPDELDPRKGYMSIDSPLARALIGKCRDTCVQVTIAGKTHEYILTDIRYSA
jgi:transcription elongation factor GreB